MEQFEGKNLPVVTAIELIAYNDVETIPATTTFARSSIALKAGKSWTAIKFTPESANFSENEKTENGNFFWEKEVNFSIPKLRNEISEELSNFEHRRLFALVTDANNETHLVFPLRMYRSKLLPGQADSSNAYRIQLSGKWTSESPFVTETEGGSGSGGLGV